MQRKHSLPTILNLRGENMVTSQQYVEQARTGDYLGIPYTDLDCQAFVEKVLADCGLRYDWRGSNDMWRNGVTERHLIENIGDVPAGAWLFTIKDDGGEIERGYHDDMKNAAHVGIYLGNGDVIHSTKTSKTNGVQMDKITSKRWTHWAKCKYINFGESSAELRDILDRLGKFTLYDIYTAMRSIWG